MHVLVPSGRLDDVSAFLTQHPDATLQYQKGLLVDDLRRLRRAVAAALGEQAVFDASAAAVAAVEAAEAEVASAAAEAAAEAAAAVAAAVEAAAAVAVEAAAEAAAAVAVRHLSAAKIKEEVPFCVIL